MRVCGEDGSRRCTGAQLAEAGLIDGFHNVVTSNVLGAGRTQFEGVPRLIEMALISSRLFLNGTC